MLAYDERETFNWVDEVELFLLASTLTRAYFKVVALARRVRRVSLDATEQYSDSPLLDLIILLAPT